MFARRARLSRDDISALMKTGRKYSGRFFYVRALPSERPAAAFSVGKKVSPLSVGRHLVKRRAAHALREVGLPPAQVFVVILPTARTASYEDLREDLRALMAQIPGSRV